MKRVRERKQGAVSMESAGLILAVGAAGWMGMGALGTHWDGALRGAGSAQPTASLAVSAQAGALSEVEYLAERFARYGAEPLSNVVHESEQAVRSMALLEPRASARGVLFVGPDAERDAASLRARLAALDVGEGVTPAALNTAANFDLLVAGAEAAPDQLAITTMGEALNVLAPNPGAGTGAQSRAKELAQFMDNHGRTFLIATAKSIDSVDPLLLEKDRFRIVSSRDESLHGSYAERFAKEYLGTLGIHVPNAAAPQLVFHNTAGGAGSHWLPYRTDITQVLHGFVSNVTLRSQALAQAGAAEKLTSEGLWRLAAALQDGALGALAAEHVLEPLAETLSLRELLDLRRSRASGEVPDEKLFESLLSDWSENTKFTGDAISDSKGEAWELPRTATPSLVLQDPAPAFLRKVTRSNAGTRVFDFETLHDTRGVWKPAEATPADRRDFAAAHLDEGELEDLVRRWVVYDAHARAAAGTLDLSVLIELADKHAEEITSFWKGESAKAAAR